MDDEPGIRDLAKEYLEAAGDYRVFSAGSAGDALNAMEDEHFDVVVADYSMPGTSGIDLLKTLREGGNDIPFIFFTGKGSQKVAIEALNLGADYYLKKGRHPRAQFSALRDTIGKVVGQKTKGTTLNDLKRMVRAMPDPACLFDPEGRIAEWNGPLETLTGVPAGSVLGRADHQLSCSLFGSPRPILADLVLGPEELRSRYYTGIRNDPDGGMTGQAAESRPGCPGEGYEEHVLVCYDERNTLTGIIDVVRRKRGEKIASAPRSPERRGIQERGSSRIIIDLHGKVLSITHAAQVISGTEGREVHDIREILHTQSHPALDSDLKTLKTVPIVLISEYVLLADRGKKRVTARLSRTVHEGSPAVAITLKPSTRR